MILNHFITYDVGQIVALQMVHDTVMIQKVEDSSKILLVCLLGKL